MEKFSISFPNIGIELESVGKSINVFGFEIAYYGIIIGLAILIGIIVVEREAKLTGQNKEDYTDFAFYAIIISIIGARLYYVIFSWDSYKGDLLKIINIRQGGLAIYGGIIAAAVTMYVFAKIRRLNFWQMADTACIGLITGQIIGRWGNFFNREAFGGYTDSLFAMRLPIADVRVNDISNEILRHMTGENYIQVHPTFLYESLWNLVLLICVLLYKKHKRFNGEIFLIYVLGYGAGRLWIEGLRTDQLLIPNTAIPVSQLLSGIMIITAAVLIIVKRKRAYSKEREDLR